MLLFPDFRQDFTVVDDLRNLPPLPPSTQVQALAGQNSPDIRAAQATVQQQQFEITVARSALLPTLSFDYFYGIDANQYALHNRRGHRTISARWRRRR